MCYLLTRIPQFAITRQRTISGNVNVRRPSNAPSRTSSRSEFLCANLVPEALNSMFSCVEIKGFKNFTQFTADRVSFTDNGLSRIGNALQFTAASVKVDFFGTYDGASFRLFHRGFFALFDPKGLDIGTVL